VAGERALSAAREGGEPPRWGAMLGWSALMVVVSLAVAALALPILHWLGYDPR